jgi:hypothetical protein
VAGLWSIENFVEQLTWYVESNFITHKSLPRPKLYRAPFWSWASVNMGISKYWYEVTTSKVEFLEISVTPMTKDNTGEIKSGFIRLTGLVQTMQFRCKKSNEYGYQAYYVSFAGWPISQSVSHQSNFRLQLTDLKIFEKSTD